MPTHPHQAGMTRILNSSPACQNISLFIRISTFSPAFLPHWVLLLKRFEEYLEQIIRNHWSEVLCVPFKAWTNFVSLFTFRAKKGKKLLSTRLSYLNKITRSKNICLIKKLRLVKSRFKLTAFSLLPKLADIPTCMYIVS